MRFRLFILLTLFTCCAGCQTTSVLPTEASRPAVINHVVFFDLHDAMKADDLLADCDELIASIPQVASYYCGRHFDAGRANVRDDYDLGLYVGFMTAEDYAAYVDHPNHIGLVTKWRSHLAELRVYDVLDETE